MDKREFVRIKSDFNIWYQTIDEDDMSFGKPYSKNISAGGVMLEMEEQEIIGTFLMLKFEIPNYGKKVQAKGKVVRCDRMESGLFDIGVQFTEIAEEDMKAINSLALYD